MKLTRCNNGHFYDRDKFQSCPHCSNVRDIEPDSNVAVKRQINPETEAKTEATVPERKIAPQKAGQIENDEKTVGVFNYNSKKTSIAPVVGWLVCIRGEDFGRSYEIKSGRNFIGRDRSMDVVIEGDKAISRQCHAVILYEPKSKRFLVQPGTSRELFYLNEQVVLDVEPIAPYEVLNIGNTDLLFVPFCGETFSWEEQRKRNKELEEK